MLQKTQQINSILYENSTNCERIGLPIPLDDDSQLNDGPTQEQQHEIDFNILNNEQRQLVDSAIQHILNVCSRWFWKDICL